MSAQVSCSIGNWAPDLYRAEIRGWHTGHTGHAGSGLEIVFFVAFVLNNEIHWFCRRHSRKSPGKQKQYPENCHWIDWIKPQGRVSLGLLQRGVFCYYGILANDHGCMLLLVVEWRWLSRFPAKMTLVHAAHNFVLRNLVLVVLFVLESKALTDRITPPLNARLFVK